MFKNELTEYHTKYALLNDLTGKKFEQRIKEFNQTYNDMENLKNDVDDKVKKVKKGFDSFKTLISGKTTKLPISILKFNGKPIDAYVSQNYNTSNNGSDDTEVKKVQANASEVLGQIGVSVDEAGLLFKIVGDIARAALTGGKSRCKRRARHRRTHKR